MLAVYLLMEVLHMCYCLPELVPIVWLEVHQREVHCQTDDAPPCVAHLLNHVQPASIPIPPP